MVLVKTMAMHLRANVVAYLALVVALSGTSYAAITLPKNSVGSKQLARHAVKPVDVHPKTRALLAGKPGATGPAGPAGPSVSGFASGAGSVGLSSTYQPVLGLGATADADHSGPLTVTFPARLVMSASLRTFKPTFNGDVAGQSFCQLELGTGGIYTPLGDVSVMTYEKTDLNQVVFRQVPVVASVDVAAGTYDVRAVCSRRELDGPPALNAPVTYSGGDLTVVATAR